MNLEYTEQIQNLSQDDAIYLLKQASLKWLDLNGIEAYTVFTRFRDFTDKSRIILPEAILLEEGIEGQEIENIAKLSLLNIVEGHNFEIANWIKEKLSEFYQTNAQAISIGVIAVGGLVLMGIILAARVSEIGSVKFYKGIPKELSEILKQASGIIHGGYSDISEKKEKSH